MKLQFAETQNAILSIFNAIKIWIPISILDKLGFDIGSVPSVSILLINIIELARLNITLYIKSMENKERQLNILYEKKEVVAGLVIKAYNIRQWILALGYTAIIVVAIFFGIYRSRVENSLAAIIIITVMETLFNYFIDNLETRYEAIPKVYKQT